MLQQDEANADVFLPWLRDQRRVTLDYVLRCVNDNDHGPQWDELNPPLWEWCHLNWFWAQWCLTPEQKRQLTTWPTADALFNSALLAHAQRWQCALPAWPDALGYGEKILALVSDQLVNGNADPYFIELAIHHEAMHEENFFRRAQVLEQPFRCFPHFSQTPAQWLTVAAQTVQLGSTGLSAFCFDNEKPNHHVCIGEFQIANSLLSETEFAEFVLAGGYQNEQWWTRAGWQWRKSQRASLPRYWRRDGNAFFCRELTTWRPLRDDQAMRFINCFEAQAVAAFYQSRLPSAAEWQAASRHWDLPPVWEWTADVFAPYPGFSPDAYREYSAPSFGLTQELRGGSPLLHRGLTRPTFRNFFAAERRDICAGLRLCRSC